VSDLVVIGKQKLTPAEFGGLADVPPEIEWLANITNSRTRRAYKNDVQGFVLFSGVDDPADFAPLRARTSSPGANIWSRANWNLPASGVSSRHCHRCSIISVSAMPFLAIS
jgi:hypothetical protein